MPSVPYYRADLARVHHEGFAFHAELVAPGILNLLEPVLERGGLVLEIGCGSGLLTKYLAEAGHCVVATDASPAMVELARAYVPDVTVDVLRVPDDPLPSADAIVSVGHPLSYLDNEEQLDRALVAIAGALGSGGVLAFDICDIEWGTARRAQPAGVWFGEDWVLTTRFSVPERGTFRREMTTFTRTGELWRRDDEIHDNVLVDTSRIPTLLAGHGIDAAIRQGFGDEILPAGLVAVIGRREVPDPMPRAPLHPGDIAGRWAGQARSRRIGHYARVGLRAEDAELVEAARTAIGDHGADPRHTVGAALRTSDGQIVAGVNVFAQGGGACAELVVLGAAIAAGHREFDSIVAVGDQERGVLGPCGVCRQLLLDYAPNISVILPSPQGLVLSTPAELLPNAQRSWFAP